MSPDKECSIDAIQSPQLNELMQALAKAQGKITNALKDKKNPFFKSSYADLSSVWECCRDPLSSNGLSIIQTVEGTKESMVLVTCLGHSSGQWIKSRMPLMIMKSDPQSLGSALTYARRYALSAIVGICADEDDDGEKAMGRKTIAAPETVIAHEDPWKLEAKLLTKKKIDDALAKFPDKSLVEDFLTYLVKRFDLTYKEWVYKMIEKPEEFNKNLLTWEQKTRSALVEEDRQESA